MSDIELLLEQTFVSGRKKDRQQCLSSSQKGQGASLAFVSILRLTYAARCVGCLLSRKSSSAFFNCRSSTGVFGAVVSGVTNGLSGD